MRGGGMLTPGAHQLRLLSRERKRKFLSFHIAETDIQGYISKLYPEYSFNPVVSFKKGIIL